MKFKICLVAAMGMAVVTSACAETWHVSSAAGGDGDGTSGAPFKKVASAVETAGPGDTIVVGKGRYVVTSALTISKPGLKVIGVSGEMPVFVADEKVNTIFNVIASDVVLQELVIRGGFYGVKIDVDDDRPARDVVIRNCTIGGTAADCIKSFNADKLRIENCQIGPSGWKQTDNAEGIDVVGSLGVTIRGCVIQDIATNGMYLKGGTRDGLIERCLVQRAGNGGILLGQDTDEDLMRNHVVNEAINCVARNNIIIDTKTAGMGSYSGKNVSFLNNTLVNVARESQAGIWIVANSRDIPAEGVVLRNNIVSVGGDRPLMFIKDAAGMPDSDHNIFHITAGAGRFVREISADESLNKQWTFAQWQKTSGKDTHSRLGDPQLDGQKFRPLAGSPAIGSGASVGVADDYFGHKRNGSTPDVGALNAAASTEPTSEVMVK